MPHTTWIVVADEAIARVLEHTDDAEGLEPVEELTDAAAHAKGEDLRRDAVGRRASPGGQGNATTSAGEDPRHLEAELFARRVAAFLGAGLHRRRFDDLCLVAAPRFLGLLRKALDPEVRRCVRNELDKDLVHLVDAEIEARLYPPRAAGEGPSARA
jgi:protein required for attachment to host cells